MKKLYIKPAIGNGCLMSEELLVTASIQTGSDITSGETVEGDARRGGSFWDDTE